MSGARRCRFLAKMRVEVVVFLLICVMSGCASADTTTQLTTHTGSEEQTPVQLIGPFTNVSDGVSSGKIKIIGSNTLQILNFVCDGDASNIQFRVGKGESISDNSTYSTVVPTSQNIANPLGQDIELILPSGLTVEDVDWLAVWDASQMKPLGYAFLKTYSPQTFGLKGEVTSGPVVLVDKKTLYIPNFQYNGGHENVRFWVGNGTQPDRNGVPIPDETGSSSNLHVYQGQNINLNLPDNVTTDNIDYFGVWSVDEELSLGSVPIKGIAAVPEFVPNETTQGFTLRLPKCCPPLFILTADGCVQKTFVPFRPDVNVYDHNETHFENNSMNLKQIKFEPYVSIPECSGGKYPLDNVNEEFAILKNGSLMVKGTAITGILPQTDFCLEYLDTVDSSMSILVCAGETQVYTAMFFTYVIFTVISTLCFAATFFVYLVLLKIRDVHRKCFTGYAFAMTMTFLTMTIVQLGNVEGKGCEVLGFLFQISLIASFTLLGILCVDIYIIIRAIDETVLRQMRIRCYLGIATAVPLLSLFISLRNLTPDVPNSFFKPQYGKNNCHFDAEEQRTAFFYVPIGMSMVVSFVSLFFTKLKIVENDATNNYYWLNNGKMYKFMWRKHVIIFLTSLVWCVEVVIRVNYDGANILLAMDLVEAGLGIYVLFLFVVNKQTRVLLAKNIKAQRRMNRKSPPVEQELVIMCNDTT